MSFLVWSSLKISIYFGLFDSEFKKSSINFIENIFNLGVGSSNFVSLLNNSLKVTPIFKKSNSKNFLKVGSFINILNFLKK